LARLAQEHKLAQQLEKEKSQYAAREAKRIAKEEAQKVKEQLRFVFSFIFHPLQLINYLSFRICNRLMKEHEKYERQEALKREREQKAQQMLEV